MGCGSKLRGTYFYRKKLFQVIVFLIFLCYYKKYRSISFDFFPVKKQLSR